MRSRLSCRSGCSWLAFGSTLLVVGPVHAATWGSFGPTRVAYATGFLGGDAHDELRAVIEANGDTLATSTSTLTAEYLAGVDVFYTAMLSDGTGPTAGDPGTLSDDEAMALAAWIADGGTLIVTVDSNGFDGPFEDVYESWLDGYGGIVYGLNFVTTSTVSPSDTRHPITSGVDTITLDNYVTFAFGSDGLVLASEDEGAVLTVLEEASGFTGGGRLLVLGDHNALTDAFIGETDNTALAENIVAWAATNDEGGDTGDSSSSGADGSTGEGDESETASGSTSSDASSTGTTPEGSTSADESGSGAPEAGSTGEGSSPGDEASTGGDPSAEDTEAGEDGCGCRSAPSDRPVSSLAFAAVLFGLRRRARRRPD